MAAEYIDIVDRNGHLNIVNATQIILMVEENHPPLNNPHYVSVWFRGFWNGIQLHPDILKKVDGLKLKHLMDITKQIKSDLRVLVNPDEVTYLEPSIPDTSQTKIYFRSDGATYTVPLKAEDTLAMLQGKK